MNLNTLNSIIDDIILEYRNNNVSESENLSRNQIEQWITQYRSILIKQDIDKGRDINPDYVQSIEGIKLNQIDCAVNSGLVSNKHRHVTSIDIPNAIDFHFKSGIINITDPFGNELQLSNKNRAGMQKNRKYTSNEYIAYKEGKKIMVEGPGELEYINVYLIPENPSEVTDNLGRKICFDINTRYPIPANMIPTLKELIFTKELKLNYPSDASNNSNNDLSGQIQNTQQK